MKSFRFAALSLALVCSAFIITHSYIAEAQTVNVGSQTTTTASGTSANTGGTTISNGANKTIGSGADCRVVTNNTGRQIFIPSGNATMWSRYIASAAPTGVTIASCNANCASAGVSWGSGCSGTAPIINHGTSASVTNTAGGYTGSVTVTCTNGVQSQSAATCTAVVNGACNNAVNLGCSAGTAISDNGQTACGTTRQWVCQGSGGGSNSGTCSKANAACSNCTAPWGATVNHGNSVTAYLSSAPTGACTSESRGCSNGTLSGTYTAQSCNAGCTGTPWGSVAHSYSNTAYASAAPAGACSSQTRTCSAGTMSGTYTATSCNAGCTGTPWGSVAHGYSNTAYASAAPAGACSSQTRTCSAGTLSGSYTATSCTAGCSLPWGGSIASGSSVTAYLASSAVTCSSQTRTCSAGTLSGSYLYSSCTPSGGSSGGSSGGGCFVESARILMADGSTKAIKDIKPGDLVRGGTVENMVIAVETYTSDEPIYRINGGQYFITGEHPVQTTDGWKAIDPELIKLEYRNVDPSRFNHNIDDIGELKVGDIVLGANGKKIVVKSIEHDGGGHSQKLYNLQLGGDHTYYSNGILVHNLSGGSKSKSV